MQTLAATVAAMTTPPFGSVLTAMVTPFDEAGAVDYQATWDLARMLLASGTDGLVVCGTTGEAPTLSHDEKMGVFRTVVEAVGGRAPIIAGTGTYDTAASIALSREAEDVGCDAILAVTPYYNKPPQEGLVQHFTTIADAVAIPMMVYNIPSRTSRLIEVETMVRLSQHPRIVATKDAVEDLDYTRRSLEDLDESFAVYSGSDFMTLPMVELGAVGVVSVASHLVGEQIQQMITAARDKDLDTAQPIHDRLLPVFEALFLEPNPMPLKGVLSQVWRSVGDPRLPLIPASTETVDAVKEALANAQNS